MLMMSLKFNLPVHIIVLELQGLKESCWKAVCFPDISRFLCEKAWRNSQHCICRSAEIFYSSLARPTQTLISVSGLDAEVIGLLIACKLTSNVHDLRADPCLGLGVLVGAAACEWGVRNCPLRPPLYSRLFQKKY